MLGQRLGQVGIAVRAVDQRVEGDQAGAVKGVLFQVCRAREVQARAIAGDLPAQAVDAQAQQLVIVDRHVRALALHRRAGRRAPLAVAGQLCALRSGVSARGAGLADQQLALVDDRRHAAQDGRRLVRAADHGPRLAGVCHPGAGGEQLGLGRAGGAGFQDVQGVLAQAFDAGCGWADCRHRSSLLMILVAWTIDAGAEDLHVLKTGGSIALRQARIVRLLDEALDQGAVATQEDLARALQTSVSTIKRDCAQLRQKGIRLPTRGYVKGIGRGQSHKAQIIECWMQGWTYDQIARDVRHDVSSIQRYVNHFIRVVWLRRQSYTAEQIAHLLQIGVALVHEYLALAKCYDTDRYKERLESCLQRICGAEAQPSEKKVGL